MSFASPNRIAPVAILTAAVLTAGCSDAPSIETAQPQAQAEFTCSSTLATAERPRTFFAPFDPVESEALCVLDRAQQEVVVAHYNIRRESFLNKLVELRNRGVSVKVAVDKNNAAKDYNTGDDFLEDNGIELVRTKPSGSRSLMHLKVAVVDNDFAMTGSFNWNGTAALANEENMVVLRDPAVVSVYRNQVLQVLGQQASQIEGGQINESTELHFAPEEKLQHELVSLIDQATESVDIAMFTLTRTEVVDALIDAVDRGVSVRAVLENKQAKNVTVDEQLEQAGGWVIRGANKIGLYSAMHHKYAIIDRLRVITGATNWTYMGTQRNDEDLLVLEKPEVVDAYYQNFADLVHVYTGQVIPDVAQAERAGVLFHTIHDSTQWGDRIVITGNHPSLGNWDPWQAVELQTSTSLFPNWTGRVKLAAGTRLEYKFVTLTADWQVIWEPGANRVLDVPETGRGVVISGPFGDTTINYKPTD